MSMDKMKVYEPGAKRIGLRPYVTASSKTSRTYRGQALSRGWTKCSA